MRTPPIKFYASPSHPKGWPELTKDSREIRFIVGKGRAWYFYYSDGRVEKAPQLDYSKTWLRWIKEGLWIEVDKSVINEIAAY